jgi:hypothetical protein
VSAKTALGGRSNQSSSWANRGPLTALHIDIGPDVARGAELELASAAGDRAFGSVDWARVLSPVLGGLILCVA